MTRAVLPQSGDGPGPAGGECSGRPGLRIVMVHAGYWPYMAATNRALTELSRRLAAAGHDVTVVCSGPPRPEIDRDERLRARVVEGVRVRRVPGVRLPFRRVHWASPLNRVAFYVRAGVAAVAAGLRADVVVTLDTPLGMRWWGLLARGLSFGRVSHVCWVMDDVAEARFEAGRWRRSNPVRRLLAWFHDEPLRRGARLIVLGECMRRRLAGRGVPPARIRVVGMWHYGDAATPREPGRDPELLDAGLRGKFVVLYSGHAGPAHDLAPVLEAAAELRDRDDVRFAFVGDAPALRDLETRAEAAGLSNVRRYDPVPWERLPDLLAIGDLHLVCLKAGMVGTCVPSKLYGSLAAGRPVAFVGPRESRAAEDVRAARAGFVVEGEAAGARLARVIRKLAGDARLRRTLGANGREAFLRRHDAPVACRHWENTLVALCGGRPRPFPPAGTQSRLPGGDRPAS